jgi:glycosyltransferase involved in cell wall biosynthesis
MRVVLAGTFAGHGGIQTHLRALAGVLTANGHELLLLSFGRSAALEDSSDNKNLRAQPGVQLESVGNATAPAVFRTVTRALNSFNPDLYFACGTGWNLFAGAIASRVPQRIFHEVMSGESYGWRDSRNLVRRFFHAVVAQANPVARNFARSFGWTKPIEVIPAFSQPLENHSIVGKSKVPYGTARAAVFGRLVPHKRIAWLVSQWPHLNKSLGELHIHGSGPEEPLIRDLIAKNDWQNKVYLHGEYPKGQAYAELVASYDLTLLPTTGAEGAPLVLLESMACDVPFVATDAGGIADYANPDCLITPVGDPNAFLVAVDRMARRLGAGEVDHVRLQKFYDTHFSHAALTTKWLAFFNSISIG